VIAVAGIDADGGGIDIYPDLAQGVISALGTAGNEIHDAWNRKLAEIVALDSQLGNGPLGEKAYWDYQPFVDAVRKRLDEMKQPLDEKVANGNRCVEIYVEQDRKSRQAVDDAG
jgi:hypothetical protein